MIYAGAALLMFGIATAIAVGFCAHLRATERIWRLAVWSAAIPGILIAVAALLEKPDRYGVEGAIIVLLFTLPTLGIANVLAVLIGRAIGVKPRPSSRSDAADAAGSRPSR